MKKILVFSVLGILVANSAMADKYTVHTNNCNPDAMRAMLDDAVRSHRAVVTTVVCDAEPVRVNDNRVYVENTIDYSSIPIVDCVPGPIVDENCCLNCR
ncbi:MAG: hypothetical protein K6B71_01330 [Alphaproteobacteria bacterium]|nr:hypothetical protein [Alphaproteobacteria bacterium]